MYCSIMLHVVHIRGFSTTSMSITSICSGKTFVSRWLEWSLNPLGFPYKGYLKTRCCISLTEMYSSGNTQEKPAIHTDIINGSHLNKRSQIVG